MKISKEVKVGIFAVTAIAIFYIGLEFLKGINFFSTLNTYNVVYKSVDGLSVSNPVTINGYRVGRVSDIKLLQERQNKVLVTIDVANNIKVGDSTKAILVNSDLLGGKAIVLEIGPITEPLPSGDTLISEQQDGITEVLRAKALPVVAKLDSTIFILNSVLANLANNSSKINNALSHLESTSFHTSKLVSENRGNLRSITNNLNDFTGTLESTSKKINQLVDNFNNFGDSLNRIPLKKTVAETNKTLENIRQVTEKINSDTGSVGKLLKNDSLYDNLNKSAENLNVLLKDLKDNPNRYVNFSLFGGGKNKNNNQDD